MEMVLLSYPASSSLLEKTTPKWRLGTIEISIMFISERPVLDFP